MTAPRPCLPSLTEEGEDGEVGGARERRGWGVSQCFTFFQTNRLSDVIVFRDVLCVYERICGGGECWDEGSSVKTGLYLVRGDGGGGVAA